jgi:hypothetical protein
VFHVEQAEGAQRGRPSKKREDDLAMMVRRLAYGLRHAGPLKSSAGLPDKALDLLRRMGLEGDPLREDAVAKWVRELEAAGWKRYRGHMTLWESPDRRLFRGPAHAWQVMKKQQTPQEG